MINVNNLEILMGVRSKNNSLRSYLSMLTLNGSGEYSQEQLKQLKAAEEYLEQALSSIKSVCEM